MGPLSGRTALVTGSNGGLGSAIVERLAADGASVFAHARRPSDDFAAMLEALSVRHHVVVSGVYFDLTDYEAMKASVRPILQESGVDILVNNAGVAHGGLVQMTPVDAVRAVFDWIERHHAWDDAVVIVTSDHGHAFVLTDPEAFAGGL